MVAVVNEGFLDSPCPRGVLTVTGLGVTPSVVSVWRVADGKRESVRGARRVALTDSAFMTDFDAPVGRGVSYELEVISGPDGASRTQSNAVTIDDGGGWLMDPLIPSTAVRIVAMPSSKSDAYLRASSFRSMEYQAAVSAFKIMGSDKPLALFGQRQAPTNLDIMISTRSADQQGKLQALLESTASLLLRPHPSWGIDLPGVMFLANPTAQQAPVTTPMGGDLTWWNLSSDVVSAPTIKPLTGSITFGDVALLYATFQAKHDSVVAAASAAGEQPTFLFDLMNPLG